MNIANKLTMLRVIMIPVFLLILYLGEGFALTRYVAVAIFIIASLTDFLDGYLARKYHLVTNFGKFMDPLADKLLVSAALIYLAGTGELSPVIVIIIISREFIISGFRLVASDNGVVIAASKWGKIKTFTTMIMIIVLLLAINNTLFSIIGTLLVFLATLFTVVSAIDYIVKNIEVFHE